ncbi:hypothetical protein HRbin04_01377 [archaeon HR04]|nr:hypothetical protein HRbin04_01377 [archaeon HR04]
MNLSLSSHLGFFGSCLILWKYNATTNSTAESEPPGCPDPASATDSMISLLVLLAISLSLSRSCACIIIIHHNSMIYDASILPSIYSYLHLELSSLSYLANPSIHHPSIHPSINQSIIISYHIIIVTSS